MDNGGPTPLPEKPSFPMRLAVIDLGSNNAQLLIVEIWEDGAYTPIYRDTAAVRLGAPVFEGGEFDDVTRSNASAAIGKFLQSCRHHEVDNIRTVATSAVREAANGEDFVHSLREEFGIHVEVVSGREEARLTALAATESLGLKSGKVFVMDVGGGTTEAAWILDGVFEKLWSLHLGPVRFLHQLSIADPPGPKGFDQLRKAARKGLGPLLRHGIKKPDWALATSGTALCLGALCGSAQRASTSLPIHIIVRPALEKFLERMAELDIEKRREWMGEHAVRADTILGGGAIFLTAMEEFGLDTFIAGGKALREGFIMDYLQREVFSSAKDRSRRLVESVISGVEPTDPRSVREKNILKLARRYNYDPTHARKTLELASRLFEELHELHWLGDEDLFYLQSAALLHEIGYHIGVSNNHLHAQYLVLHSELEGFHRMELRLLSNLVRYHGKELPREDHATFAKLPEGLKKKVQVLAGILRVADALDFTHRNVVENLDVEVEGDTLRLIATASRPIDLEVHEVEHKGDLLEKALNKSIEVVVRETKTPTEQLDPVGESSS